MKLYHFLSISALFVLLGILVGNIIIEDAKTNKIENILFDNRNVEYLNAKSKNNSRINIGNNKHNTIVVYINPFCATRAKNLEDWHNLSMEISDRVIVILTGEMIYYIDYLVRKEKRYEDGFYLLKNKKSDNADLLKNAGAEEAVFIIDYEGKVIKAFEGPGIPESFLTI